MDNSRNINHCRPGLLDDVCSMGCAFYERAYVYASIVSGVLLGVSAARCFPAYLLHVDEKVESVERGLHVLKRIDPSADPDGLIDWKIKGFVCSYVPHKGEGGKSFINIGDNCRGAVR